MQGETSFQDREQSIRFVMSEEGYTPEQIEEYVSMARETTQPPTSPEPQQPPFSQEQYQVTDTPPAMDPQLQARIEAMERSHNESQVQVMRDRMEDRIGKALNTHVGIKVLLDKSAKLAPQDGTSGGSTAADVMKTELERMTLEALRVRKARGETFKMGWFDEEVAKAADSVYAKFRSVIGDPDKLQRAPETESTQESFVHAKPVEPPTFVKGDDQSTVREKAHSWTTDVLNRLAHGLDGGEGTKV
jgi:hypothetical protein